MSVRVPRESAPSVRAQPASNSVAVTLTTKNVAAGHKELRTVSLDTAATAKPLRPPHSAPDPLANMLGPVAQGELGTL